MSNENPGHNHHHRGKLRFRRRIFLVKNRFQLQFALIPIVFFLLFLIGAAAYLYWFIDDTLNYFLFLPHCRLDNFWPEISPAIIHVAAAGGGAFLLVLALWSWRRFSRLKRDVHEVDLWAVGFKAEEGVRLMERVKDKEVRIIAERLVTAAEHFHKWEGELLARRQEFLAAAKELQNADDAHLIVGLADLRDKWRLLWDELNHVRIDERLS